MKQQVSANQLIVGQPLPWDVCGSDGVLLLNRGQIIESQRALDRFIEEGLHVQGSDHSSDDVAMPVEQKPSALQHVLDARRQIGLIVDRRPEAQDDFPGRIEKAVTHVLSACEAHARVGLSCTHLLQDVSYTVRHPVDTAILAQVLADALELDAGVRRSLVAAALTMNIGMYEVQDKVHALAGPLNEKLLGMIRAHPAQGVERLQKFGINDPYWLTLVRQHHEHQDGSGYPTGLKGDAIDLGARLLSLADRYCAVISDRGYRLAQKPPIALRELYVKHGQTIDVRVAGTLIKVLGIYPVGTLVRLITGEIGVVTGPGDSPDHPEVHAVYTKAGAALDVASLRKTHVSKFAIEEVISPVELTKTVRLGSLWGKDAKLR